MTSKIYIKIFLTIAIFANVVNSYAKSSYYFKTTDFSNGKNHQEAFKENHQKLYNFCEASFFKSIIASNKNSFFAEEITIEDFEEYKKQVFYLKKKSLFGSNSNAILYKIVFESAYSKVLEETQQQKTLTKNTVLNLHKKFEVYLI